MLQEAPQSITKAITQFGGHNQYGDPIWRCVLAQSCTRWFGGRLPIWPKGELSAYEYVKLPKGKGVLQIPTNVKPIGWDMGPHQVLKYPCKGWILERWMPPHIWGNKFDWENARDEYGDRINGEFPTRGDYFMLYGPWEEMPSLEALQQYIAFTEYDRNNRRQVFEIAVEQLVKEQEEEEAAEYEKYLAMCEQYHKSEILPMFNRISLNAQRVRDEAQALVGNRSHLGAGQS